ncbi:hypothetical protein Tco_0928142 [Tanacetum coccineum]
MNMRALVKLKQILDNRNGFKALKLQVCADFFDAKMLKVTQSPQNELEHVEQQLRSIGGLSAIKAVVDAILWCCCPRSLNLTPCFHYIDYAERNQAVKFMYKKLLQQEDEGQLIIQMALSSSSEAEKHFSDLNSLLTSLPRIRQEHTITFTKEEGYNTFPTSLVYDQTAVQKGRDNCGCGDFVTQWLLGNVR